MARLRCTGVKRMSQMNKDWQLNEEEIDELEYQEKRVLTSVNQAMEMEGDEVE